MIHPGIPVVLDPQLVDTPVVMLAKVTHKEVHPVTLLEEDTLVVMLVKTTHKEVQQDTQ